MALKLYNPDWEAQAMVEAREGQWVEAAAFAKLQEHYKNEVFRFNTMMAAKNAKLTSLELLLNHAGVALKPEQV